MWSASLRSISWRLSPRVSDTTSTPAPFRISVRRSAERIRSGAASAARAAISAWAMRPFSHWMRKLAMEGRKIRISPSMTNRMVMTSTLPDSPWKRPGALCLSTSLLPVMV